MANQGDQWPLNYQDFLLHLHTAESGRFGISVSSPAGEGDAEFTLSGLPSEWSHESQGYALRDLYWKPEPRKVGITPSEMGTQLYKTVFTGRIRSLFERSVDLAKMERMGLRIKIFLSPSDPAIRLLQGFPWELLCREDTGKFLALSRWTPVIRSLPVSQPPQAPMFPNHVRVLAALASPRDLGALDLHQELSRMKSLEGGNFEVVPWRARLSELRKALDQTGPFHVLHFLGHGDFHKDSGQGVLAFENPDGSREVVAGDTLAEKLRDFSALQLVVLNACKTAQNSLRSSGPPFGGVAAALIQAGFPAVLAMQEEVDDHAAIALSASLYSYLALGRPLEGALVEARHAVHSLNQKSFAWMLPSLFLRASPTSSRLSPSDCTVRDGISLFLSGRLALARQRFQQALQHHPQDEEARLFTDLSRMAMHDLSARTIGDIDDNLQSLISKSDPKLKRIAQLALGILRLDFSGPRGIRTRGITSPLLFSELERTCWTDYEREIAQALNPSQSARILLKLPS
jgi:hypothetical protein